MAQRDYRHLVRQIAELEDEAAALRQREIEQVIEQIRPLIEQYGIRPSDIFDAKGRPRPVEPQGD